MSEENKALVRRLITNELLRRHIAATLPLLKVSAWLQSRGFRIHTPNEPVAQGTEQRTSNPS